MKAKRTGRTKSNLPPAASGFSASDVPALERVEEPDAVGGAADLDHVFSGQLQQIRACGARETRVTNSSPTRPQRGDSQTAPADNLPPSALPGGFCRSMFWDDPAPRVVVCRCDPAERSRVAGKRGNHVSLHAVFPQICVSQRVLISDGAASSQKRNPPIPADFAVERRTPQLPERQVLSRYKKRDIFTNTLAMATRRREREEAARTRRSRHLPEKFRKSREKVEKRLRCSHCWASWGVLVGRRFCGGKGLRAASTAASPAQPQIQSPATQTNAQLGQGLV